jgi:ABC-type lipoprotein export system ATPase subunit
MIQLRDLEFRYKDGGFGLNVPELDIPARQTAAMIGPSGTGKTTLLDLIAGYRVPDSGTVRVGDVMVSDLGDGDRRNFRVRNAGLVFQEFELLEYLDILDNILLPYRISPALTLDDQVRKRARGLAQEVGLGNKLRRNVKQLSQGERQRTAICRALLTEPPLLLCDEPTGNLDPVNKGHVLDILFEMVEKSGTTLVVVTHDHDILPQFERVIDFRDFHGPATDQEPES